MAAVNVQNDLLLKNAFLKFIKIKSPQSLAEMNKFLIFL